MADAPRATAPKPLDPIPNEIQPPSSKRGRRRKPEEPSGGEGGVPTPHPPGMNPPLQCMQCGARFRSRREFEDHERQGHQPHTAGRETPPKGNKPRKKRPGSHPERTKGGDELV